MTETCARRRPAARSGPHRWRCALTAALSASGVSKCLVFPGKARRSLGPQLPASRPFPWNHFWVEKRSKKSPNCLGLPSVCVCVCEAIHLISPSSTRVERQRHLGEATSPSALVQSEWEAPSYAVAGSQTSPRLVRCGHRRAGHASLSAQKTSRVFRRCSVKGLYFSSL